MTKSIQYGLPTSGSKPSFSFRKRPTLTAENSQTIAALDIGSRRIVCLIAEASIDASTDQQVINVIGIGDARSRGIRQGIVFDIDAAADVIQKCVTQAQKMAGKEAKAFKIGVSNPSIESRLLSDEVNIYGATITERQMLRALFRTFMHVKGYKSGTLHLLPIGFSVDGGPQTIDPRGKRGNSLKLNLIEIKDLPASLVNTNACLERCKISSEQATFSGYAAALGVLTEEEIQQGVTVIEIAGDLISVLCFMGGYPLFAHTFLLPNLNKRSNPHRRPSSSAPAKITMDQISIAFGRVMGFLEQNSVDPRATKRFVLTGEITQPKRLLKFTEELFRASARVGMPIGIAGLPEPRTTPRFATAVGLLRYDYQSPLEAGELALELHIPIFKERTAGTSTPRTSREALVAIETGRGIIQTGKLVLFLEQRLVELNSRKLSLTDHEYEILECLSLKVDRTCTNRMLFLYMTPNIEGRGLHHETVANNVLSLQTKLAAASGGRKYIHRVFDLIYGPAYLLSETPPPGPQKNCSALRLPKPPITTPPPQLQLQRKVA